VIGRMQPPAHSPLNLPALAAGLSGALGTDAEARLHARIRTFWGARDVILTDCGTSALTLALLGAIRTRSPLIALPAYGCYDLATAAIGARARVLLYDIDPETLGPDTTSLRNALKSGASIVVIVHQYGIPVEMEAVRAHAAEYDALVVEDAAQAIGARLDGGPAGAGGHVSVLSFGRGKGLSGGNGGALLSNHAAGDAVVRYARQLVRGIRPGWGDLGRAAAQWLFSRPSLYSLPAKLPFLQLGATVFHEPHRPNPLSRAAAQLIVRGWNSAQAAAARRRATAVRLLRTIQHSTRWRTVSVPASVTPGYLRLPVIAVKESCSVVLDHQARVLGAAPGYPLPLHRLPQLAGQLANPDEEFPGASTVAAHLFTLPTHTLLDARDLERIEEWLLREPTFETGARIPHAQGTRAMV